MNSIITTSRVAGGRTENELFSDDQSQSSIVAVGAAHDTLDTMRHSRNRGSNNKAIVLRYRRQPVEATHAWLVSASHDGQTSLTGLTRPMAERTPCELRATLSQL